MASNNRPGHTPRQSTPGGWMSWSQTVRPAAGPQGSQRQGQGWPGGRVSRAGGAGGTRDLDALMGLSGTGRVDKLKAAARSLVSTSFDVEIHSRQSIYKVEHMLPVCVRMPYNVAVKRLRVLGATLWRRSRALGEPTNGAARVLAVPMNPQGDDLFPGAGWIEYPNLASAIQGAQDTERHRRQGLECQPVV